MVKRMVMMLATVAVIVAALGFVKYRQIQAAIAQASSFQPPPEAVTTTLAREETWRESVRSIGTLQAVQGVMVSADLPGIVEKIAFESGRRVQKGDVLVVLDTRQERAQLEAAEARHELARLNLARMKGLREKGVTSQAEYDTAAAEYDQSQASAGEVRAAIARKTLRAPFSGVLGIRQVNLGQYLRSGDPVVPLQSLHPVHVNFSVPQQVLSRLRVGGGVLVTAEGQPGAELRGGITAINSVVDEATRNVQVQATLGNPGGKLKPGMFVEVEVLLDAQERVVTIPASAIRYAPYGDSVFVVEERTAANGEAHSSVREQFVKLGSARGDQIAILSGVEPGEEVVTSGVFKLRNGVAVLVNNEIKPGNDPSPRPEDS